MSEDNDRTTEEQPDMPAWVPRSEPGDTADLPPAAAPTEEAPPEQAPTVETPEVDTPTTEGGAIEPPPVDDSATRSFPPLDSAPAAAPGEPVDPTPEWSPPPSWNPPAGQTVPPGDADSSTAPPPVEQPPPASPSTAPPPAEQAPPASSPFEPPPASLSGPPGAPTPTPQPPPPAASPPPAAPIPASAPTTPPTQQPAPPPPVPPSAAPPPASAPSWGVPPGPGTAAPPPAQPASGGYPSVPPPTGVPGSPPPTAPPSGGGNRTMLIVIGVLLAAGLLGGLVAVAANRGEESETATSGDDDDADGSDDSDDVDDRTDTTEATTADDPADQVPVGAEELARSVVQIQLLLDGEPVCTGSGTVVDTEGTVLTNFHVVEQSPICPHDDIAVAVADSSQSIPTVAYVADLLVFDAGLDLAVIRVRETIDGGPVTGSFEPVTLGDSDAVELGDELRVIGFPGIGGETVTFTTGSVSGFAETPEGGERSWLKTDATIAGGNSGGLAADAQGRFVGIPTRAGSGDGQIVDCRVIADSNGDGRLDGEDSCVPIGGFINGIRPLSLALPLIDEAATATPIDQGEPGRDDPMSSDLPIASNPTWTSTVDADGDAIDQLTTTLVGAPEVCVTWDYEAVPENSTIEGIWLLDGELVPEASVEPRPNEGPTVGSAWACITATEGLPVGTYEFVWFVDDELIFGEGIVVGDGATAAVEVENISDVPICVVQFNPTNTSTWGLNEIDGQIEPGDSITVTVAIGPIDARIIDCNGDIRIEDASGFEVDEDLIVSVD